MLNRIVVVILLLFSSFLNAQQNDWWMTQSAEFQFIEDQMRPDKYFHSSIHPYKASDLTLSKLHYDTLWNGKVKNLHFGNYKEDTTTQKFFDWMIYPLMDGSGAFQNTDVSNGALYHIAAGVGFRANISKQWSVDLNYMYGLRNFNRYDNLYFQTFQQWPEKSLIEPLGNAFGQHYINANTSWSPSNYFRIQVGYGKNHLGDGVRSLFLSRQSTAYPYGKIESNFWRMKYVVLYTFLQDRYNLPSGLKKRNKYMTTHYLSWNIFDNMNVSLFESVVWQAKDSLTNRGYDINYLNPIIFFRPVEYAQGSADNVLLGISLSYKINKNNMFYFQWVLDEFLLAEIKAGNGWWANKFGVQAGYKSNNLFGVKGLYAQIEYNWVRPFTFTHGDSWQNYGHYNTPLAHPFGANFMELLADVKYQKDRWQVSNTFSIVAKGLDDNDSTTVGGNIFDSYRDRTSEYGHKTLQGVRTNYWQNHTQVSYLLFPESQLRLEGGLQFILAENQYEKNYHFQFYVGIRSAIWNIRDRFR